MRAAASPGALAEPVRITLREVGPRDGLQGELPLPVASRLRLIAALVAAGARSIEAAAFVSPVVVPAMGQAADVIAGLPTDVGVTWWVLVPNVEGARRARDAGIDHLTATVSASEAYSRRNVGMSVADSLAALALIAGMAPVVDAVVSCAFGSPDEGEIPVATVAAVVERCRSTGAVVTLADTTGMATPRRIDEVLGATGPELGMHLHDTRGTALLNAYAAMHHGVVCFDTAIGGLGGSPFSRGHGLAGVGAEGAAGSSLVPGGNLATEDLVYLCEDLAIATGLDLDRLLEASAVASKLLGRRLPSRVAAAGPRTRLPPVEGG